MGLLAMLLQAGGADPDRGDDTLSLGVARAWIRGLSPETAWEASYVFHLGSGIYLQPDLQWIQHPGGGAHNTLVLGLRVHLER